MMLPGMRRETRRHPRMTAMVPSASSVAAPDAVPAADARTRRRPRNSPGSGGVCRPNKSRICVLAIRIAMPLVKPITTGRGMYFTAVPEPGDAEQDQHHAGHQGAHEQPVEAVGGDDAGHDHDECPGGSADLHARAAEGGDREAGDHAAIQAGLRRQPEAMANAIASGRATSPTVTPARRSAASRRGEYPSRQHSTSLGTRDWRHAPGGARRQPLDANIFIY